MSEYRKAAVLYQGRLAGLVEETESGFRFTYEASFIEENTPISLSLPLRAEPYNSAALFPFFSGLLPEGWYLEIVVTRLKLDRNDAFGILLATCKDTIGAVSIEETK